MKFKPTYEYHKFFNGINGPNGGKIKRLNRTTCDLEVDTGKCLVETVNIELEERFRKVLKARHFWQYDQIVEYKPPITHKLKLVKVYYGGDYCDQSFKGYIIDQLGKKGK